MGANQLGGIGEVWKIADQHGRIVIFEYSSLAFLLISCVLQMRDSGYMDIELRSLTKYFVQTE